MWSLDFYILNTIILINIRIHFLSISIIKLMWSLDFYILNRILDSLPFKFNSEIWASSIEIKLLYFQQFYNLTIYL